MAARVQTIRPMLAVSDLPRTMAFYCDRLGFRCVCTFGEPPVWCDLVRDGQSMMFNAPGKEAVERDVPRRSKDYQIYYFNCDDAAGLHAELSGRGVAVSAMRVTAYGMKEFEVRDPDDYWLWFGQETSEPPTVRE
ncbi:MAG: VOC family protein [Phycisphaeraceae bacterium]|nr:VOC family protein [Phycisphaeraceae bacterium]